MFFSWKRWLHGRFQVGSKQRPKARAMECRPYFEQLENRLAPATYTVITNGDGPGVVTPTGTDTFTATTLRGAINAANATAGVFDTINFFISPMSTTILVGSVDGKALPAVTDPVIIDGTTDAGFKGFLPVIELNGASVTVAPSNGLSISAGGSTVKALTINRFAAAGILLDTNGGNTVIGNSIGTDRSGAVPLGNQTGIFILNSSGNNIGGTTVEAANRISGNAADTLSDGISIDGGLSDSNKIKGNLIGVGIDPTKGTVHPVPNGRNGISIRGGGGNEIGGTEVGAMNVISGNGANGIYILGGVKNTIAGNHIGVDITGNKKIPNGTDNNKFGSNGVWIDNSSENTVGGAVIGARNIISGNVGFGVKISDTDPDSPTAQENKVQGNYIGTDVNGEALGNGLGGVRIDRANKNTIGGSAVATGAPPGNLISGNMGDGISIVGVDEEGVENKVFGNLIGTFTNGEAKVGNSGNGVYIEANDNIIGDVTEGNRNVVSGNKQNGMKIANGMGNIVQNNFIGTTRNGDKRLGNYDDGIALHDAKKNKIGGVPLEGNVISGNGILDVQNPGHGVSLFSSSENLVQGNYIGLDATGTLGLGNFASGVQLAGLSNNNIIGGKGTANYIADNRRFGIDPAGENNKFQENVVGVDLEGDPLPNTAGGVRVGGLNNLIERGIVKYNQGPGITIAAGKGHRITEVLIAHNDGLGIDLTGDGVTPNDVDDADDGPNKLQNFPVLTAAIITGTGTHVEWTIDSDPGHSAYPITIEFFDNTEPDPSGYGEGETYLDSYVVSGPGSYSFDLPSATYLTATATDNNGNTSEFSRVIKSYVPGSIGDRVWTDRDADGIWEPFEPGLSGVTVSLYNGSGTLLDTQTTDADGYYLFTGLAPGTYSVGFTAPTSYFFNPANLGTDDTIDSDADPITGRTATFTLDAGGSNPNLDAGLYQKASVGDYVWEDIDGNALQDGDDVGRPNVTVQLLNAVGTVMATTTTDTNGAYTFGSLIPGTYSLRFTPPTGFGFAPRDVGTDDTIDNDVEPSTWQTLPFTLFSGDNNADLDAGLQWVSVSSFTPSTVGFVVNLSQTIAVQHLNLYDTETSGLGLPDVTLVGATVGDVRGSLLVSTVGGPYGFTRLTFVNTGDPLPADTYTVTLRSAVYGIMTVGAGLLDGNNDGIPGDNYVTNFTVSPSTAVVVSVPDFARGAGQPVDVPATDSGLPLRISDGTNVTSINLSLQYDPALLQITAAVVGSGVPAGASVSLDTSTPGLAVITFTSPTALPAGPLDFVKLTATVPNGAPYKSKHLLDITNLQVNGGAIPSVDNDGLHVASYFGEVTGNKGYSATDANSVLRVAVGLDSGFVAYRLLDPVIIADISANGQISSIDSNRILQETVGLDRAEIPPLPAGVVPDDATGPDPYLNIPTTYTGQRSSTVTVTVDLDISEGLDSLDAAISYDTSRLEVLSVDDIQRGSLTFDFGLFAANLDAAAGVIRAGLGRDQGPISGRGSGSVLQITFRIRNDAPLGAAILNLRFDYGLVRTQLNEGGLDLFPDPVNEAGDELDGLITVLA